MSQRFLKSTLSIAALSFTFTSIALAFQTAGPIDPITILRPSPNILEAEAPPAHLRIDASLVLIPVQVTTDLGAPVTHLAKEDFRILEDGVEQKITHFAQDDAPISIGVVFDSSGSMHNKMHKSLEAASTFFKTANPEDEFFLVDFNERAKLAVGFTPDSGELYRRISHTRPFGRTSLFDAIELAVRQMKKAKNARKAIVILSDGGDNRSRRTFQSIRNLMQESDVQMYSMGIFDEALDGNASSKRPREEQEGPRLLDELTELTGGRNYRIDNLDDLPAISARIGAQLRNQYLIGYSPSNDEHDGKYRRVKLAVTGSGEMPLRVQYRTGYYAPVQ